MSYIENKFDIIVAGGGHAGCEGESRPPRDEGGQHRDDTGERDQQKYSDRCRGAF